MANFDNKLNINNVRNAYTPNLKKDDNKVQSKFDDSAPEIVGDGAQAAESYGRILVKKGKIENPEMIQNIKDSIDFFLQNTDVAAAAVKASDDAYELLEAEGASDAYEKACCGACSAALNKSN